MDKDYSLHLTAEELDYELAIRGVSQLGNTRRKTGALAELLHKENTGTEYPPKTSDMFNSSDEVGTSYQIFQDIVANCEDAIKLKQKSEIRRSLSRLHHVQLRLERITPANSDEDVEISELLQVVYDTTHRVAFSYNEMSNQPLYSRNDSSGSKLQDKDNDYNINKEIPLQSNDLSRTPVPRPTPRVSLQSSRIPSNTLEVQGAQKQITPNIFQQRQLFSERESMIDLNLLSPEEIAEINEEINSDLNPSAALFRPSIPARAVANDYKSSNQPRVTQFHSVLEKRSLGETRKFPKELPNNRNRIEFNQQYRMSTQNHLDNEAYKCPSDRIHHQLRDENLSRRQTSYQPNLNREQTYLENETYKFPSNSVHHQFRDEVINRRQTSYQPNLNREQAYFGNDAYTFPSDRVQHQLRDEYLAQEQNNYLANLNREQNFDENDFRNINNSHLPNNNRRPIPVNQWKIEFSGDGKGLHLYDFLSQIAMFMRSERTTDKEMMCSIFYLLSGRAKIWYQFVYDRFRNWNEVVRALKQEFLPANYDFVLFCDISNRVQRTNETFGEYITHMQALFKCLTIPMSENHKLFIVQKNLLPRYAQSIAPLELRSLEQLSEACRRIDNAHSATNNYNIGMPFQQNMSFRTSRPNMYSVNQVDQGFCYDNPEISAFQQYTNNNRFKINQNDVNRQLQNFNQSNQIQPTCYNCNKVGHLFKNCNQARNGIFCYVCGLRDVISRACPKCTKNCNQNSAAVGQARNSAIPNTTQQ